jgi:hypothetical protein
MSYDQTVYSDRAMRSMGRRNEQWGICGFTSSLYAMYQLNVAARPFLINAPRPFTILAEIKTYLQMLYAESKTELLNDIEWFTRSFGVVGGFDFGTFTPRSYILYINNSTSKYINANTQQTIKAIVSDPKFSIALPPEAVSDYLQRVWEYSSNISTMDPGGDAIIGVLDKTAKDNSSKPYGGLCHYVYRKSNKIYSWGNEYSSVTDASANFVPCWFIALAKK